MGYVSHAQRKAVWASKKDGGKGNPNKKSPSKMKSPFKLEPKSPFMAAISGPCKAAAKKKFKVWPSAYASGWGVRCTKAGGPSKIGKSKKK